LTLYSGEEGDDRPSIAVLPFADMSPERDQGYFCEGVAEEILNALSNLPQLRVAARSPSFEYRESQGDVRRVGRELGVKSVLEGSVRKSNNRLRITAQLVAVSHGYHLWSKSFDKELKDIFLIQDEIAKSIAETLLESITPLQRSALKTTSTSDVTAYDYYLRGRQFISRLHKTEIGFARRMFRKALDLDPDFALAWAGYADCFSLLILYEDPIASYREEARRASQRALELDPNLAEAHASRGLAFLISEEFEAAETEFNKALALNPRFSRPTTIMAGPGFIRVTWRWLRIYSGKLRKSNQPITSRAVSESRSCGGPDGWNKRSLKPGTQSAFSRNISSGIRTTRGLCIWARAH
jgi:adenylate cyclase